MVTVILGLWALFVFTHIASYSTSLSCIKSRIKFLILPGPARFLLIMKKKFLYALLICAAIGLRIGFFDYETLDYQNFLKVWVEYFRANGGFLALKDSIGNYNIPYLYFLALFSYIPVKDLYLIKILSCIFDFVLAYAAYKLSGKKAAFFIVLFLPTVVMNSALWAQCDSIYVSLALLSICYGLDGKGSKSMIFMALSFGFKLQAVFLMPCLIIIWIYKKLDWKYFLLFPITYTAIILPAILLGHPVKSAFTLYLDQMNTVGSAPNYNSASLTAICNIESHILIALAFAVMVLLLVLPKRNREGVLILCALMVTVIPFFLPHMHDRYFYAADIMSVIVACTVTFCIPAAVSAQVASMICYVAYLTTRYFPLGSYWITNKTAAWLEIICIIFFAIYFLNSYLTREDNLV